MTQMKVLTLNDAQEWQHTLESCAPYDYYFLPRYHALAEELGEGDARLFVYTDGAYTIALPLLLRELDPALDAPGWKDATSVYGYAGPIASHREIPSAVVQGFRNALESMLRQHQVVTVFSRMHPLLTNSKLLEGIGEYRHRQTVSIDLTLEPALQRSQFRKAFKEGINKLRRLGVTFVHDREGTYLGEFCRIYDETMRRVEAAEQYFFPRKYYERLMEDSGASTHLFLCTQEGRAVCAGLFFACHGIIQYHLGGTADDALKLSPMKVLVDGVRLWGNEHKMRVLHLGGGVTSAADDSLLHYKRGFSDRVHDFAVWRWVLDAGVYSRLCEAKTRSNAQQQWTPISTDFFPAYRAPSSPFPHPTCVEPAAERAQPESLNSESAAALMTPA